MGIRLRFLRYEIKHFVLQPRSPYSLYLCSEDCSSCQLESGMFIVLPAFTPFFRSPWTIMIVDIRVFLSYEPVVLVHFSGLFGAFCPTQYILEEFFISSYSPTYTSQLIPSNTTHVSENPFFLTYLSHLAFGTFT